MITEKQREYNKKYYLANRDRLIKNNSKYQKDPINTKKRNEHRHKRYAENHLGFRDKNLRSHDKCKQDPKWIKRKRIIISIWGMQNRTPEKNKIKWNKYYKMNKEKYKLKRRNDPSQKVSQALRRIEYGRNINASKQLEDINILLKEVIKLNG